MKAHWISRFFVWAALIIFALFFALPFVWMLGSSVKTAEQIFQVPPIWIPWPLYERYQPDAEGAEAKDATGTAAREPLLRSEYERAPLFERVSGDGSGGASDNASLRCISYETYISQQLYKKAHPGVVRRVPLGEFLGSQMWRNYAGAATLVPLFRYLLNTLIICLGTILGNLLSASLVAYSLAILNWRGRELSFKILIATMLLPPQVTMIPVFLIFRRLGMIDTFWPLIIPAFLGSPFFIFLLRQFFLGIPAALTEAARIDGCSEWGIYWRIILPLAVPALATVTLFAFIWAWTDFLTPLIYLQDQSNFTLSIGLQQFQESHTAEWGMLMAASTLMTLPMIALFFCAQKTFVRGIVTTGLKG